MGYLQPAQYEAYGLDAGTADELVAMASALMEAYCRRPSLLAAQYVERLRFTAGSQTGRLSYGPLAAGAVTGVRVRYARGRRGETADLGLGFGAGNGTGYPAALDAEAGYQIAAAFGLPGTWTTLDPATLDVYLGPREITFPTNVLGLGYNEAEVTYTAGLTTIPDTVMAACAQIVRNAQAQPALTVKTSRLDTLEMQYFGQTLIDDGVRRMLAPYVAERLS
jgi:hypothetical protein